MRAMNLSLAEPAAETQREPLVEILVRVEAELEAMSFAVEDTHSEIARCVIGPSASDPDYLQAMQAGDLMAQKLAAIAGFIRVLSLSIPYGFEIDSDMALATLKLSELVRKLGNGKVPVHVADEGESGDFELF